ncbi:MAG: penicillin acylase family protein [Desulfomonile sp.]|nr:penicillin acylase family protein [Desulfomonile sp.]
MKLRAGRVGLWIAVFVLVAAALGVVFVPRFNRYQTEGTIVLPGLNHPVTITRDEKGMAYVHAQTLPDAIMAQGFVTAQDRLFQMQVTRLLAEGRISELAGEAGKSLDVRMRTIGIHRNAKKHAAILDDNSKRFIQKYVDGVNAFITTRPNEHHLEFKPAGIRPEPWEISDTLAVVYYMGWTTSANLSTEILAQMLVDKVGPERARELFPLNVNPEDPRDEITKPATSTIAAEPLHLAADPTLQGYLDTLGQGFGSNNWAVAPRLSKSGKPIVADDPHLDARILPGIWYPIGIITPQLRAVGVMVPGIPGMVIGRTDRFSMGVTNNYGDCQDLYVETVAPGDPSKYKEGPESFPFEVVRETLKIKDSSAASSFREEPLEIRYTRRGPVISGVLPGVSSEKVITLRWAAAESMGPKLGLEELLTARSARELREAIRLLTPIVLNCVFADSDGHVGWHVSGKLPIRSQGDSTIPYVIKDGTDNWTGWIPFEQMPNSENPSRGWLGTCNHKTIDTSYPYYYSSYFAPSYRYRRIKQLLEVPGPKTADEHWEYQRDPMNLMAAKIAPVIVDALVSSPDTGEMGKILSNWDHRDDPSQVAPTLFQLIYRNFFRLVFEDELGPHLTEMILHEGYFWQERLQKMVLDGSSPWFDNVQTSDNTETLKDLFRDAALQADKQLRSLFGRDRKEWTWGNVHQIEFVNPIRREGFGKSLLGGGRVPMGGSRETLYCAWFEYDKPFDVILSASLRMVADLGDPDKVLGVLPGGVSGRTFHPHQKDQIEPFMRGDKVYWWFSDRAIKEHAKATLVLKPQ